MSRIPAAAESSRQAAIKLPAEKFHKFGVINAPKKHSAISGDEYFYEWLITYLRKGNPEMSRNHFQR